MKCEPIRIAIVIERVLHNSAVPHYRVKPTTEEEHHVQESRRLL